MQLMQFSYVLWSFFAFTLTTSDLSRCLRVPLHGSLCSKEVSNIGAGYLTLDEPCESCLAQSSGPCVSGAGQCWVLLARGFISTTAIRR